MARREYILTKNGQRTKRKSIGPAIEWLFGDGDKPGQGEGPPDHAGPPFGGGDEDIIRVYHA